MKEWIPNITEEEYNPAKERKITRQWAREHVIYRLVNQKTNQEILKDCPHMVTEDLAIVFYLLVEQKPYQIASVRINYSFLDSLGLEEKELYSLAEKNTRRFFPLYLAPITETICNFTKDPNSPFVFWEEPEERDSRQKAFIQSVIKEEKAAPFFVLTNASGLNGATVVLYQQVLRQIAEALGGIFYVIPSSIHEVLVIPRGIMKKTDINAMIKEVNTNIVEREEILSQQVYIYDPVIDQLSH